jgi:GNAT superfamily N-acetyltransferase
MPGVDLVIRSNGEFFLRAAAASPGGSLVEFDGVRAGVVPAAPERPLMNSVVCERGARFDPGDYATIAAAYQAAGVSGWTVWVDPADGETAELLKSRGHVLDAQPRAMVADIGDVAERPAVAGSLVPDPCLGRIARLNDEVYGYPGSFVRTLTGTVDGCFAVTIDVDGEPAAAGVACDVDDDCHITLMATLQPYRGRGFATAIIRHLTADAAERGRSTTSLVATRAGAPVYTRMGYRDVGWLDMWERQR